MFWLTERRPELEKRTKTMRASVEGSVFVLGEKKMDPGCSLQLASDMRPCTQSTKQRSDDVLRYVVKTEIMEESW